jgi:hypothetical protein
MANGEKIEAGAEIIVVAQTGLKLTVIRKTNENQSTFVRKSRSGR